MLLDQVVAELSAKHSNWRPSTEGFKPDTASVNGPGVTGTGAGVCDLSRTMSRELELHLESEREFFNRLLARNGKELLRSAAADSQSECESSSSGYPRPCISIPFQWEERPGKPKNNAEAEEGMEQNIVASSLALSLPPPVIRKGGKTAASVLPNDPNPLSSQLFKPGRSHLMRLGFRSSTELPAGTPHSRMSIEALGDDLFLRKMLQKSSIHDNNNNNEAESSSAAAVADAFARHEEKLVLGVVNVNYPDEFQWRSLRTASPMTIFEGPEGSPASKACSNLLSYCSSNGNSHSRALSSCSSISRDSVPVLLANRLASANDLLNAVPVERSESQRFVLPLPAPESDPEMDENHPSKNSSKNNSNQPPAQVPALIAWKEETEEERQQDNNPLAVAQRKMELSTSSSSSTFPASPSSVPVSNKKSSFWYSSRHQQHYPGQSATEFCSDRNRSSSACNRNSYRDPFADDNGLRKLIDTHDFSRGHSRSKRWPDLKKRMKMVGCCPCNNDNDIALCSSMATAKPTPMNKNTNTGMINHKMFRDKKISCSSHRHKIKVEWTKLQEKDELQK